MYFTNTFQEVCSIDHFKSISFHIFSFCMCYFSGLILPKNTLWPKCHAGFSFPFSPLQSSFSFFTKETHNWF